MKVRLERGLFLFQEQFGRCHKYTSTCNIAILTEQSVEGTHRVEWWEHSVS